MTLKPKRDREGLLEAARARADELRRPWLDNIRDDIRRHGGTFLTRSVIGLAVYRSGAWAMAQPDPVRRPAMKVYRALDRATRAFTGLHMDATTIVGKGLHLVHLEGPISIHPETVIGDRVGIMHGVTIGNAPDRAGLPIIGDDVFIGVGAVILGPVVIGEGARIAANSLVMQDVPAHSTAIGVPARILPRIVASAPQAAPAESEREPASGEIPNPVMQSGERDAFPEHVVRRHDGQR